MRSHEPTLPRRQMSGTGGHHELAGPRPERADTSSVYDNVRGQIIGGVAIGGALIVGATIAGGFLGGPLLAVGVGVVGSLLLAGLLLTGRA